MSALKGVTAWVAALCAFAVVGASCTEPSIPLARSVVDEVVTATPVPPTPTAIPLPTPQPEPTVTPDPTGSLTPDPVAVPGLSPTEIRIAVIHDDQTGGTADGLFADAVAGVNAWRTAANFRGGIGGREIVLEAIDSRLSQHRQALEQVCNGDYFAIVGSHSLGDYEGASLLGSNDCNLADFPGAVYGAAYANSPVTFLSNPFLNTSRQAGPARYLLDTYPDASENLALFSYTGFQLQLETLRLEEMLIGIGIEPTFKPVVDLAEDLSERVIPAWDEAGVQALVWNADPDRLIALLAELDEPPVYVLCELACYSDAFIEDGGDLVEGVYAWVPYRPFAADDAANELRSYELWLNEVSPGRGVSSVGFSSWMAGRLFEESMLRLTAAEEVFTREQLIDAARTIDAWDGRDVLSLTNPAAGIPTPCFALLVVRNGEWVQEYPAPPGDLRDLDCDAENVYELVRTAPLGLTDTSSIVSDSVETDEQTSAEEDLETPAEVPE